MILVFWYIGILVLYIGYDDWMRESSRRRRRRRRRRRMGVCR